MSYSNINRIVLIGRLTADPELRALPSGSAVCGLRVACNTVRKNAEGEHLEKPNFFNVSVFGGLGETVHRYMRRGRRLAIDGRLEWSEWESREGVKRQAVEIVAERVQFLDGPSSQARSEGSSGGEGEDLTEDLEEGQEERELVGVGSGAIADDLVF